MLQVGVGRRGRTAYPALLWIAAGSVVAGWAALVVMPRGHAGQGSSDSREALPAGVTLRVEVLKQPRSLRIYEVELDLYRREWEVTVVVGPDPDGPGGAEAQLMSPMDLARSGGLVLAINANAFAWADPRAEPGRAVRWRPGMGVDILGWAHDGQREASPPDRQHWSVWQEPGGAVRMGQVSESRPVRWAAAGFGALVVAGKVEPMEDRSRHPRTAVGLDATGRRWLWVVVDGRRPGYSEGMTLAELAQWMRQRGCHQAINLDGGGSSVLLVRDWTGNLIVRNRPSDGQPRPVPVLMGVRVRPGRPEETTLPGLR